MEKTTFTETISILELKSTATIIKIQNSTSIAKLGLKEGYMGHEDYSKSPEQHLLRNSGHHQRQQWSHL
jgi:hypothetical protein